MPSGRVIRSCAGGLPAFLDSGPLSDAPASSVSLPCPAARASRTSGGCSAAPADGGVLVVARPLRQTRGDAPPPAPRAADRRPARARPGDARRLSPRRRGVASGRGDATACERDLGRDAGPPGLPVPRARDEIQRLAVTLNEMLNATRGRVRPRTAVRRRREPRAADAARASQDGARSCAAPRAQRWTSCKPRSSRQPRRPTG